MVSVSNRSGYLFITLSQEFLNAPVEIPKGMEEDVAWQEQVNRVRRLSVDALVNAITELGVYTHIYLLVDDGTGQGVRILREQVGYLVNGQLPWAHGAQRQHHPDAFRLSAAGYGSHERQAVAGMSRLIAWDGTAQDLSSKLLQQTVLQYRVDGEHVSEDGQSAVVTLAVTLKNADGVETQATAPMRCRRWRAYGNLSRAPWPIWVGSEQRGEAILKSRRRVYLALALCLCLTGCDFVQDYHNKAANTQRQFAVVQESGNASEAADTERRTRSLPRTTSPSPYTSPIAVTRTWCPSPARSPVIPS